MKKALTIIIFLAISLCAYAGPNQSELESYRVLVPDWSKTSGGESPALSPDGKTLVYISQDKIWVLSDLDKYALPSEHSSKPPRLPEPWQLDVKLPDTADELLHVTITRYEGGGGPRNVDWSPDGKRVAFIYEGRLFVAEDINPKAKAAKARMLTDVTVWKHGDEKTNYEGRPLQSPRWSPDGTKIAFVRPSDTIGPVSYISVLDVKSGKEKVVAKDVMDGPGIWGQPWSPDSRSLAYSSMSINPDGKTAVRGGISMVRVDEGIPRKLIDESETYSPSWSPSGDKLVFVMPYEDKGISAIFPGVYISDTEGKNPRPIAKYTPSKDETAAAMAEMRSRLQRVLKEQYPGVYTEDQLKQFTEEDVTDNEVMCVLMAAAAVSAAKTIGGEFQKRIESDMKEYAAGNIGEDFPPCVTASELLNSLPEEKREPINKKMNAALGDVIQPLYWLKARMDMSPVWSPDGKKLAFVRWDVTKGKKQLLFVDVEKDKASVLFEENSISNPTWTSDGKAMVVVSSRNLAYKKTELDLTGFWPEFITMPSYPEIWLIEPK